MLADLHMMGDSAEAKRAELAAKAERQAVRDAAAATPTDPLMDAVQFGDVKSVESLLARGASRKSLNAALLLAARSEPLVLGVGGHEVTGHKEPYAEIAKLLLDRGASVEARDEYRNTPLILAAGNGETAVVRLLLQRRADIEDANPSGETPLIRAACNCPSVDMPDTDDVVRLLLDKGANIEAKDKEGRTPLIAAAEWGRASILKIFLDRGAHIEARDNRGRTALLVAAAGSALPSAEAVHVLLARGADFEAKNNKGQTALMVATSGPGAEKVQVVKMLLNRGAARAKSR